MSINLKQIAYQQATNKDNERSLARQVYEAYPNFDEEVADEVKAELFAGYQLRVAENQPKIDQRFIIESGNYIPVDVAKFEASKGEKYHRTVSNIMAYTPQAFGALRQSNPQLHSLIKAERDQVNKYCSNRLADLKKAIKAIKNEGVAKVRGATKTFAETVKDTMDGLKKKCANAKARGDDSANEKKLITAISEFNRKWVS